MKLIFTARLCNTVKFRKKAPGLKIFKGPNEGLLFGGAYLRKET